MPIFQLLLNRSLRRLPSLTAFCREYGKIVRKCYYLSVTGVFHVRIGRCTARSKMCVCVLYYVCVCVYVVCVYVCGMCVCVCVCVVCM